ncbi:putative Rad51 family DNA repair protein [Aspergillus novofumigatus IBT 16806]|uniref:Putative Rad51 family DNA repair protein n=1 Tax=Aspergillus novofumigatus (strain IBT 16806) TaxID=1392255 RepID=A0A2I1BTL3_ASPN1|nr:putative Rad51 family DNA repair protein [Aspergillus novofumigatus IBT 16806]PKX88730.1 putative Rad51 family DNA repair protein [Aspergillus novofumigatus IBT 16806]
MAASFGEKLLREVRTERLDELLHDLRILFPRSPGESASQLGVKQLDALLEVFMPSLPAAQAQIQQAGRDTYQEQQSEHEVQHMQADVEDDQNTSAEDRRLPMASLTKQINPVIEISSISSAAGKTQLLYYLTAIAVLPSTVNGIRVDGLASAVVFIDADGRFDAERLRTVACGLIDRKLKAHSDAGTRESPEGQTDQPVFSTEELESIIATSLQHVHVFRPQSSASLLATLESLQAYLLDIARHYSSHRPLHAIFIDSATAFFWQDKLHDDVTRTENIGRPVADIEHERNQKRIFFLSDIYAELVQRLKNLQRHFGCIVVYTCNTINSRSITGYQSHSQSTQQPSGPFDLYNPSNQTAARSMPSFRCPLPAPWGTFATLRLVVRRDAVRPFPPMMTARDAQRDAVMRQNVILEGRFLGWVNEWERGEWPRRFADGLKERNGGVFSFHVGRGGIEFA